MNRLGKTRSNLGGVNDVKASCFDRHQNKCKMTTNTNHEAQKKHVQQQQAQMKKQQQAQYQCFRPPLTWPFT